jgi:hypothetical protein
MKHTLTTEGILQRLKESGKLDEMQKAIDQAIKEKQNKKGLPPSAKN